MTQPRPRWQRTMPSALCHRPAGCWRTTTRRRCPPRNAAGASPHAPRNSLRPELNTILSRRDYRSGAWHLGAVWPRDETAAGPWRNLPKRCERPASCPIWAASPVPSACHSRRASLDATDPSTALLARHARVRRPVWNVPSGRRCALTWPMRRAWYNHRAGRRGCGPERSRLRRDGVAPGPAAFPPALAIRPAGGGGAGDQRVMSELLLSRARLRRDAPVSGIGANCWCRRTLLPRRRVASVWSGHCSRTTDDRQRDFLWREERPGEFMTLSCRPPVDVAGLFDLEFKPFAPALSPGDRLGFTLRANPVVARAGSRGNAASAMTWSWTRCVQSRPAERARIAPRDAVLYGRPGLVGAAGRRARLPAGGRHSCRRLRQG